MQAPIVTFMSDIAIPCLPVTGDQAMSRRYYFHLALTKFSRAGN